MALTSYSDLKSDIADWAARSDFTAQIPTFISLAEALFNNGDDEMEMDPLRVREMESHASLTVTDGEADLPADFLEVRAVTLTSGGRPLDYATSDWFAAHYPTGDAGFPSFYTIRGSKLLVSADVELSYYAAVPALSDDAPTNWLLEKQPSAYLWGGLYFLSMYAKDLDRAPLYMQRMAGALKGLQQSSRESKAGRLVRRAGGPTP
jgi:hypothetical protein